MCTQVVYEVGKYALKCGCLRGRRFADRSSSRDNLKAPNKPYWMVSGLAFSNGSPNSGKHSNGSLVET